MTHGGRRAKARRLQVRIAEDLARALGLSVEASPPTVPGERGGVLWVPEGAGADLRVRSMGQLGDDVALLSRIALERVRLPGGRPFSIEAKNFEAWSADSVFRGAPMAFLARAINQVRVRSGPLRDPLVVLGKNRFPPLAVVALSPHRAVTLLPCTEALMWVPGVGAVVLWGALVEVMRRAVSAGP